MQTSLKCQFPIVVPKLYSRQLPNPNVQYTTFKTVFLAHGGYARIYLHYSVCLQSRVSVQSNFVDPDS
jgi:hypothetical protein